MGSVLREKAVKYFFSCLFTPILSQCIQVVPYQILKKIQICLNCQSQLVLITFDRFERRNTKAQSNHGTCDYELLLILKCHPKRQSRPLKRP